MGGGGGSLTAANFACVHYLVLSIIYSSETLLQMKQMKGNVR